MMRFFTRLLALILSGVLLAILLAVLLQIEPVGAPGWGVFALLAAGAVLAPVALYRALIRGTRAKRAPRDNGGGIAVGLGLEQQRQRREDGDGADLDLD